MHKLPYFFLSLLFSLSSLYAQNQPSSGFDVSMFDKSVKPQDDFFRFVNGNWLKQNPIPAAESRWGNFNIIEEQNVQVLKSIMEKAASAGAENGSNTQKIGTFYQVAMDTQRLEQEGTQPVQQLMQQARITMPNEMQATRLATFHKSGISALFGVSVSLDIKDNTRYRVWLFQSGLTLPDRDYYLKTDEKSVQIRSAYLAHMQSMFALYGLPISPEIAQSILDFETQMASAMMSRVENRNAEKRYNKWALGELTATFSAIDWMQYLKEMGLNLQPEDTVIVSHVNYFKQLNSLLSDQKNTQTIGFYLTWKVIKQSAPYLSQIIETENFKFNGGLLQGAKEQKPRWKRTIASANAMIGELLAQEYVKEKFSPEAKAEVNLMVDLLREAFRERIQKLDWMSKETKEKAIQKLNAFNRKIGYPDTWKDYTGLRIENVSYWQIYTTCAAFGVQQMIDKYGKPVNRDEWNMLPQTVNAYYSSTMNEIVFPAAIMQPPFYNPQADAAVNFGAIGAVIGHEFSHGFDDQGSKYDGYGNLNTWWTPDDRKKFEDLTRLLVDQYNQYQPLDSVFVNGQLTLGENIADLAGLTIAYDAYLMYLKKNPSGVIDGYTPEQRFFIGFAQVWRGHSRPEYLRNQVITDPHAPQQYRVIGTLSNMPSFYQAFGVKKGDKMWRESAKQPKIW